MRVLVAHVRYRERGGEDAVVEREMRLLEGAGVDVTPLIVESADFDRLPPLDRFDVAARQGDHALGRAMMREAIRAHRPDVVHAHNLYPMLGPGALDEARSAGCAIVHTWHNYRPSCLAGTHILNGAVCRRCDVRSRIVGVGYGCYRHSRAQSLALEFGIRSQMRRIAAHVPDIVVCLTEFQRSFYVSQGISAAQVRVKPNSVDSGNPRPLREREGVVFVGRLSPEKGILELVRSWDAGKPPLLVVGEGPLAELLGAEANLRANVSLAGPRSPAETRMAMRAARVLAFPSVGFEGLPLVVLEALSEGTPVVAFDGGAVQASVPCECVPHGDFSAMAKRLAEIVASSPGAWEALSAEGLSAYSAHFTDESNLAVLLDLYGDVTASRGSSPGSRVRF